MTAVPLTWRRHGRFWLLWIAASTPGPAIAGMLGMVLLDTMRPFHSLTLAMGMGAVLSGWGEWLILQRYVGMSPLWIGVGAIAVASASGVFALKTWPYPEPILQLASVGLVVMVLGRSVLLRHRLPRLWLWVVGNAIAWGAMIGVGFGVGVGLFEALMGDRLPLLFYGFLCFAAPSRRHARG